jgi:hypothetical protein
MADDSNNNGFVVAGPSKKATAAAIRAEEERRIRVAQSAVNAQMEKERKEKANRNYEVVRLLSDLQKVNSNLNYNTQYISTKKVNRNVLITKLEGLGVNMKRYKEKEAAYETKEREASEKLIDYNKTYNELKSIYETMRKNDYSILIDVVNKIDGYYEYLARGNPPPKRTDIPTSALGVRRVRDKLEMEYALPSFTLTNVNSPLFTIVHIFIHELLEEAKREKAYENTRPQAPSNDTEYTRDTIISNSLKLNHDLLGISPSATNAELASAFRKISLKTHPDKNKTPGAEERFKKLSAAHQRIRTSRGLSGGKRKTYRINKSKRKTNRRS